MHRRANLESSCDYDALCEEVICELLIERRAGLPELRRTVELELSRLSASQRDAVRLRVVEERSYGEISLQLDISEQTARARVSRGLRAMARALEPHRPRDGRLADCDTARGGAS